MRETCNLGPVERIPLGEGRTFHLDGEAVAVFRLRTGGVHAVQADCPHRSGPLADGLVAGERVVCPLHGMTFDLRTGAPARDGCAALRLYPVTVDAEGDLLIQRAARLERAG